jgi:lipoprotein-releasing system permease protein
VLHRFEFFVALRYLKAKRKNAVISVITAISVLGVAAGVMALIVALAVTNGFRATLQENLLGATAHVMVLDKKAEGISEWRELLEKLGKLPHVIGAAPSLYAQVMFSGVAGANIKGIVLDGFQARDLETHMLQGSLNALRRDTNPPGIILGSKLARATGSTVGSILTAMSPQGEMSPYGIRPNYKRFQVAGIFETGFYDLDATWAFTSLKSAQALLTVGDVVNSVELKLDDIYTAPEVAAAADRVTGSRFSATNWQELNSKLLNALKLDRVVSAITIGLITLVAGLNILITLIMMTMEKYRDIAILLSMGAKREQIRRIFIYQGVLIGVVGTVLGLIAGYGASIIADRYQLIPLDEEIYSLAYVPFQPRWIDGVWVAAVAITVSFLATIYPARQATAVAPAEALRYE